MKIVIVSKFCKCEPNDTVSAVTVGWDPYCVHSVQVARCGLSPQGPCVSSLQCGPQNFLLGDPCPRPASQVGHTAQGRLRPSWARPLSTLAHWPLGTGLGPLWAPRLPAVHLLMGRRSAHTPLPSWARSAITAPDCAAPRPLLLGPHPVTPLTTVDWDHPVAYHMGTERGLVPDQLSRGQRGSIANSETESDCTRLSDMKT